MSDRREPLPAVTPDVVATGACADAVAAWAALETTDGVIAGYPYDGTLVTAAMAARTDSAESAEEWLSALEASTAACDGQSADLLVGPMPDVQLDAVVVAITDVAAGSMEPTVYAFTAVDEVVIGIVCNLGTAADQGRNAAYLQQQVDAFEAAAG